MDPGGRFINFFSPAGFRAMRENIFNLRVEPLDLSIRATGRERDNNIMQPSQTQPQTSYHSDVDVDHERSMVRLNLSRNLDSMGSNPQKNLQSLEVTSTTETCNHDGPFYNCPICMSCVLARTPTATKCGHVFCQNCITRALTKSPKCPLCKRKVAVSKLLRLFM